MIIRQAEAKDYKNIKALIAKFPKQLLQYNLPKAKEFFVAEHQGKIVACCALEVYSKRLAEVRSLVVDTEFQSKGLGSKLIKQCLAKAKKLHIYEVLSVTGAIKLFEKQGFKMFNSEKYALIKVLKN